MAIVLLFLACEKITEKASQFQNMGLAQAKFHA